MARTAQLFLILAALAVSLAVGMVRMGIERAARSVAIVLDGNDARALAVESDRSLERALVKFRTAGLTGVAAFDQALPDLVADGQVSVVPAAWMQDPTEAHAETGIAIIAADPRVGQCIAERLVARFPLSALDFPESGSEGGGYDQIVFRGRRDQIEAMGLGLDRSVVDASDAAGLTIVARTLNYPGVTNRAIRYTIGDIAAQQAGYMIFGEDEVLGYPDLLPELADALEEGGLVYGSVEFAGQEGDAELCRLLGGAAVRVHSITEKELPNLTREQATQRFVRAAVERNVRVCYVRALTGGWDDRFNANVHYVRDLAERLGARGFALGAPSLFEPIAPQRWQVLVIGVGIAAAAVMLLALVLPLRPGPQWALLAIGAAIAAALAFGPDILGRKALALLSALVFPTLGLVALARRLDAAAPQEPPAPPSWPRVALTSLGALLAASAISLTGGLLAAALLSSNLFLIKGAQFSGVKVAMLAPLLALAVALVGGAWARPERATEYARRVGDNFRRFFGQPVLVWQAVAAGVVLGATLLLVVRTGNDFAAGVAPFEMKFRALLENWLGARPRTKEFLFGHPALILAVAAALRRQMRPAAVLLLAGAVGQVSLLNTFCHLHSPLALSLQRTANALWLGAALGCLALAVWWLGARARRR